MRKIKFISILLVLSMLLTVPVFAFSTGFADVSDAEAQNRGVSSCPTRRTKSRASALR